MPTSRFDAHPLRQRRKPDFASGSRRLSIVDLFCGAGGLTLGVAQSLQTHGVGLRVALALDFEPSAMDVFEANFPEAERTAVEDVAHVFEGELLDPLTLNEARLRKELGSIDLLVGGPPCQGHSNLNNRSRRIDIKNALYLTMIRAAEVLKPRMVIIENVPAVLSDRLGGIGVVALARDGLEKLGYTVDDRVLSLADLGTPQSRRRHVLVAVESSGPRADQIFDAIPRTAARDLRWAIGDLVDPTGTSVFSRPSVPSPVNAERMAYLLDNEEYDLPNDLRPRCQQGEHKYKSMYGRLRWDAPAQTITSGFGSIGQGRYMHPERARALTPHEAARIQGFPDYFDFSSCRTRTALATMIGNAVPPQLGSSVISAAIKSEVFSIMEEEQHLRALERTRTIER